MLESGHAQRSLEMLGFNTAMEDRVLAQDESGCEHLTGDDRAGTQVYDVGRDKLALDVAVDGDVPRDHVTGDTSGRRDYHGGVLTPDRAIHGPLDREIAVRPQFPGNDQRDSAQAHASRLWQNAGAGETTNYRRDGMHRLDRDAPACYRRSAAIDCFSRGR